MTSLDLTIFAICLFRKKKIAGRILLLQEAQSEAG